MEIGEWLRRAFDQMLYALVLRGQPDPRVNVRGPQVNDALRSGTRQSEVGLEQNEYVYRGLAAAQHEFVNVVLLSRAGDDAHDLYRLKERLATELSIWGSRITVHQEPERRDRAAHHAARPAGARREQRLLGG